MKPICLSIDCRMIGHSGIGTYLQSLIGQLVRDPGINVICMGDPRKIERFEWARSVQIILFTAPIFSIREQLEFPFKIPACDLFWSPQYNIPIFPIRAKKRVVTIHDVYHLAFYHTLSPIEKTYAKLMLNGAVRMSDAVITVSNFSKQEILSHLEADADKIHVIHNGVKPFLHVSADKPLDAPYILIVGNIKPHKNLLNGINAFKAVMDEFPDLVLCCVGEREKLRTSDTGFSEAIASIGNRLFFTGYVDDATLGAYYRDAEMLLFPSYYEGFGLPILEAMQFSLPIAASNAASIPEVGEEAVLYFNPFEIEEMAECIRMILSKRYMPSPESYTGLLQKFTWERSANEHAELFRRLTR